MKLPLTILIISSGAYAQAQEDQFVRLRSENLACIVENIELYRAMGDPVYVDASKCPPTGKISLLDNLVNEIPKVEFTDGYDSFLVLTPSNLDCLGNAILPENAESFRFYPDQCRIEAE